MAHKSGVRYCCYAALDYLDVAATFMRVECKNVKARYIALVRYQTDLAYSLHQELRLSGSETITLFKEFWRARSFRRNGKRIPIFCGDARRPVL
jgi:hypothetical protein